MNERVFTYLCPTKTLKQAFCTVMSNRQISTDKRGHTTASEARRVERLQKRIVLSNDIQKVPQLTAFVGEACKAAGYDAATTMRLKLAIEEAVVNVMKYAYPSDTRGDIYIEACTDDTQLQFTITDNGIPFDPTAKEDVDTSLPLAERPIGGLGIHLVRQIMDIMNYEYVNRQNVLTLRKNLS